jgi:hypothetical protein
MDGMFLGGDSLPKRAQSVTKGMEADPITTTFYKADLTLFPPKNSLANPLFRKNPHKVVTEKLVILLNN